MEPPAEWEVATLPKLFGFSLGVALFFGAIFYCEPGFIFLVDHANLLFHEAGHPLVGLFSQQLETYGGTLGQLAFHLYSRGGFLAQRPGAVPGGRGDLVF